MLTVIAGSMFSEKSTELQRRGRRLERAGKSVLYFKPKMDNRYSEDEIVTHDGKKVRCLNITDGEELLTRTYYDVDAILIDEVQFIKFIAPTIERLLKRYPDLSIIVAGLDMDFSASPFQSTAMLMAMAEHVVKLHAICSECGQEAWVSARRGDSKVREVLGSDDLYYPLCRECYYEKENGE
jgi:thymidine kinase